MALLFFPRGGSAQVARYLARELVAQGHELTVLSGSLGEAGEPSHAASFYAGLDVRAVDYGASAAAPDPLAADPPFHPSFEDRPGAPDRVFARVDDAGYERLVAFWARELEAAGAVSADLLHLHHLSPLHEAARRVAPEVPIVGHVHGTELLMLEAIEAGPPAGWVHAAAWRDRLRRWAQDSDRLLVLSPDAMERVPAALGVDRERLAWAPNGFDPAAFVRRRTAPVERLAQWRRWLVEEPRGWDPSGVPGSVAYRDEDLAELSTGGPVLLYVGRFTEVKRLPLLIRAHARARARFHVPAPLVLLGGFPGEWEGPHPLEVIRELDPAPVGPPSVFLAGWHGHEDLPAALNAADLVVLPSVREQFGQVLVEGMACGLPVLAARALGPATIVDAGTTGWLVPPDDEDALVEALVEVVNDPAERTRRGEAAYVAARERYGWPALAERVAAVYAGLRPASG